MSDQECALYGELVRHLRDRCAEQITQLDSSHDSDAAKKWVDEIIRAWLFTPGEDMHGSTPRQMIWRERKGEPNVVYDSHKHDMFFDDCPVCQAMKEFESEAEWHWYYDDGGFPLIAEYDPEGWDAYWKEEDGKITRSKESDENDDDEENLRGLFEEDSET